MFIQTINSTKSIEELKTPLAEIVKQVAGTAARVTNVEDWGLGALNRCLKVKIAHPAETFFIKIENDDILPVSRRGQIAREVAGKPVDAGRGRTLPGRAGLRIRREARPVSAIWSKNLSTPNCCG